MPNRDANRKQKRFILGHNQRGRHPPNYKGGHASHSLGYNTVAIDGVHKLEHRIVWERHYKCCLLPKTIIHHKDGNKKNNDIKNLEPILGQSEHIKHHIEKMVVNRIESVRKNGVKRRNKVL